MDLFLISIVRWYYGCRNNVSFPIRLYPSLWCIGCMDPTLEESARISGASLFTITRKITIPLVMPSILSGALLIMLYSMAQLWYCCRTRRRKWYF